MRAELASVLVMAQAPPGSRLFPYTTLFRSQGVAVDAVDAHPAALGRLAVREAGRGRGGSHVGGGKIARAHACTPVTVASSRRAAAGERKGCGAAGADLGPAGAAVG